MFFPSVSTHRHNERIRMFKIYCALAMFYFLFNFVLGSFLIRSNIFTDYDFLRGVEEWGLGSSQPAKASLFCGDLVPGKFLSLGWKGTFHSFPVCSCCCLVFVCLFCFEPSQRRIPCRHGFIQVCLGQKEVGEGECSPSCVPTAWHLVRICLLDAFVNGFVRDLSKTRDHPRFKFIFCTFCWNWENAMFLKVRLLPRSVTTISNTFKPKKKKLTLLTTLNKINVHCNKKVLKTECHVNLYTELNYQRETRLCDMRGPKRDDTIL